MKQPDETLDFRVRQALDQLPDTPPPGTTFDADRLWQQLRPALQKPAASRRPGWVRWASAACLVGVLGFWVLLRERPTHPLQAVRNSGRVDSPVTKPDSQLMAGADRGKTALPVNKEMSALRRAHSSVTVPNRLTPALPVQEQQESVADAVAIKPVTDTSATVAVVPEPVAKPVAATVAKRHFQVVHLNELQAEEQIQPRPQRSDRFVRMGTGRREQPPVEDRNPTITWSLANQ